MSQDSYRELRDYVDGLRIIDTHEHLYQEPERLAQDVDVLATWFPHYASSDLRAAGMTEEELVSIWDASTPLEERWATFEPWWERIRNTGYARALDIAARDLYGVDGINAGTYQELSRKMKERNREGLYGWVLGEMSKIDVSILNMGVYDVDTSLFAPVVDFTEVIAVKDRSSLEAVGRTEGRAVHNLEDLVSAIRAKYDRLTGKIVGVKIAHAYRRPIFFEKSSFSEAEEAFTKIFKVREFARVEVPPQGMKMVPEAIGFEELRPLQDYLVHKVVEEAERRRLPIQIHTGLHEGNENIIDNSNPVHLVNLFMEYRDARFDIFHGGWPYCGELGALAKNFPNVYIDMCWMHIISPSRSRSALSDWLDEVPANKIMGFGGDYLFVEGVYGHAVIAKENIARVLAEKVNEGSYTMNEAKKYARWLLRENPERLFFPEGL